MPARPESSPSGTFLTKNPLRYITVLPDAFKAADRYLLSPHDLGREELEKAFRRLMRKGADFGDLYSQYARAEGWGLEEGIVKSSSFSIEEGVGVRAMTRRVKPKSHGRQSLSLRATSQVIAPKSG